MQSDQLANKNSCFLYRCDKITKISAAKFSAGLSSRDFEALLFMNNIGPRGIRMPSNTTEQRVLGSVLRHCKKQMILCTSQPEILRKK